MKEKSSFAKRGLVTLLLAAFVMAMTLVSNAQKENSVHYKKGYRPDVEV